MGSLRTVKVESAREENPTRREQWNVLFVAGCPTVLGNSPSLREWVGWVKGPCHMQEISHVRRK